MALTRRILLIIAVAIALNATRTLALDFGVERIATSLDHPVYVTQAPHDSDLLYVVEQRLGGSTTGRISTIDVMTGNRETFLTIDGLDDKAGFDDGGLHTMAFHPDFQSNGRFYVSWVDSQGHSRVDEFTVANGSVTMSDAPSLAIPPSPLDRAGTRSGGLDSSQVRRRARLTNCISRPARAAFPREVPTTSTWRRT